MHVRLLYHNNKCYYLFISYYYHYLFIYYICTCNTFSMIISQTNSIFLFYYILFFPICSCDIISFGPVYVRTNADVTYKRKCNQQDLASAYNKNTITARNNQKQEVNGSDCYICISVNQDSHLFADKVIWNITNTNTTSSSSTSESRNNNDDNWPYESTTTSTNTDNSNNNRRSSRSSSRCEISNTITTSADERTDHNLSFQGVAYCGYIAMIVNIITAKGIISMVSAYI